MNYTGQLVIKYQRSKKLQPVEELKLLTALADNTEENQRIILTDLISYYHQNSLLKNNAIAETIFKTHLFGHRQKGSSSFQ